MSQPSSSLVSVLVFALACCVAPDAAAQRARFEPAGLPVPVGPLAGLPELGDLNGDGALDVVLACGPCCGHEPSPDAGHLRVLLGAGGFRPDPADVPLHPSARPDTRAHVHAVVLADVNHDARLDLLATLPDAHALAVHLGDGAGGFTPAHAQPFFAHRHPYEQLQVRDVDGDGHPDALCTDMSGNGVTLLAGSGTGMFASTRFGLAAHTPVVGAPRPAALAVGDLDGDGLPDLVATTDEAPEVVVLRGLAGARFEEHSSSPHVAALPANSLRLADLDLDGRLDLVTGSTWYETRREGLCVAFGDGAGGFGASRRVPGGGERCSVAVGDLNGDGRPDLVASSYDEGVVRVLLNRADDG